MESRNFQLDAEWNIVHYPEQPLGFGILIIGDERHFVDQNTSFWLQNEGKNLQQFLMRTRRELLEISKSFSQYYFGYS